MRVRQFRVPYEKHTDYPFLIRRPDRERDLIFIHIPKTGGTSIRAALDFPEPQPEKRIRKHYVAAEIKRFLPADIWDNAYKFAFVRNPWERLVSQYWYRIRQGATEAHHDRLQGFRIWVMENIPPQSSINLEPQWLWVTDGQDGILVDRIFRFDKMQDEFERLRKEADLPEVELPHLNVNARKDNYRDYYDDALRIHVANYYQQDIEHFNFTY